MISIYVFKCFHFQLNSNALLCGTITSFITLNSIVLIVYVQYSRFIKVIQNTELYYRRAIKIEGFELDISLMSIRGWQGSL